MDDGTVEGVGLEGMSGNGSNRVLFGPFAADLHTHELWKYGVKIKLVGQPFEILAILLAKPGELVTRDELRERLWPGDTFVDFDHGLNAAVNRLRETLHDSVETPRYVETLPRRGYRFIAPVERAGAVPQIAASQATPLAAAPAEIARLAEFNPVQHAERPALKKSRKRLYFLATSTLLVLVLGGTFLLKHGESSETEIHPAYAPVQRIQPLTALTDITGEPAFSPDGGKVAFRRESAKPDERGIFIKTIGTDQLVQLTRNEGDTSPAWSPDGQTIAFSRFAHEEFGIYLVPATRGQERLLNANGQNLTVVLAGAERKLDTQGVPLNHPELAWSGDGKTIAFSGRSGIFLLSMENMMVHRLTEPPPLSEDWGPAFSPDGESVLFVRTHESGIPEEILSVAAKGGAVERIVSERARILGPPQWSMDGRSVIFASDFGSHPGLWRVSAEDKREAPAQINDSGWHPSVARKGFRLAYQRSTRSLNIWQLDLTPATPGTPQKEQQILVPSTSETDQGPGPQISPDGKKLAFMSDRSGTMEIWASDRDGSNPIQLTALGGAGTPRWSPDSQSVAFDADGRKATGIYSVKLGGGAPQPLTSDEYESRCPSWSHDSKWIYFASRRPKEFQVWKVPADGGSPVQVTRHGGHAALESADGKFVYYAKTAYANPEIWQVPVEGGAEKLLSPQLHTFSWASWAVVDQGIVFAGPSGKGRPIIGLFESAKHRVTNVGETETVPFWLGASRDAKYVVFDQPGWQQSQIMLVENFR